MWLKILNTYIVYWRPVLVLEFNMCGFLQECRLYVLQLDWKHIENISI
jgi:hypothetical protein